MTLQAEQRVWRGRIRGVIGFPKGASIGVGHGFVIYGGRQEVVRYDTVPVGYFMELIAVHMCGRVCPLQAEQRAWS